MTRVLIIFAFLTFGLAAQAAEEGYPLDHITPDLHDKASLQRGMKTFMNYCFGCHSLKYQRYKRTAADLDIPEDLMKKHLMFDPNDRIGSLMLNSLSSDKAKNWFGQSPPDLTLEAKLKEGGVDWIYTYLRTFYKDSSRPFGVNNLVFPNVAMPDVMENMQGVYEKGCKDIPKVGKNGGMMMDPLTNKHITEKVCGQELIDRGYSPLKLTKKGELSPKEYDKVVYDLSNFLYYMGEPARLDRTRIGVYVLLFLAFFYVFAWLLGREYEKEYH